MKKIVSKMLPVLLAVILLGGCGDNSSVQEAGLKDGIYTAEFQTDSSMFHVNEACDGKGTLTVKNGEMTIHISLGSKNIVNLYPGLAADAQKDGAQLLMPTEDTVTYSDGMTEEVYGFDVPVPVLDEEFDLALIGTKGKWYDHKVRVFDPVLSGSAGGSPSSGSVPDAGTGEAGAELVYESSMELQYAQNFKVDYYEGGYTMLTTTMDGARFLLVPEDQEAPRGLDEDIATLQRPVTGIYLVASSVMDIFSELGGLDTIAFSGQKEDGWYIEAAREAMAKGEIVYAGKYNKPDYERIVSGNCRLAIENMMITHSPEVTEKLEDFGIPVMIDASSYETDPLGRVEWVKFYGALLGKEEEAERIMEEQTAALAKVAAEEKTGQTVAFFYITSNGLAQVRQSSDYIPKMIELAGGSYIFEDLGDPGTRRSTVNLQIEEFYAGAKDADYLIYNSSIDGGVSGLKELIGKCGLLADFRAVKEGNVWCTTNDLYQQPLSTGDLIEDIHAMLQNEGDTMHYLFRLE